MSSIRLAPWYRPKGRYRQMKAQAKIEAIPVLLTRQHGVYADRR